MSIKKRYNFKNIVTFAAVSLFAGFTVCFFSPAEIYTGDPSEFIISVSEALLPMLITAAAVSSALFLILMLLLLIGKTAADVAVRLIFGATLAGYVQMLFLNGRLAKITGDAINFPMTDPFVLADFLIFYAVMLLPLILYAIKKSKPNGKLASISGDKIVSGVCAALIAMQTIGFVPGVISAAEIMKERYTFSGSYLAYEPILSLSKKNNVIVFLTDRLDGDWMQEALDRYPELYDTFDGFTFYRNNISRNPNTDPSVPEMLSGLDVVGLSQPDYIERIWKDNRLLSPLHNGGYRVNLLLDRFMYKNLADVESYGFVDNIRHQNLEYHINNLGEFGVVPTLIRLSMIKMMPYAMKQFFSLGITSDFINNFIVADTNVPVRSSVGIDSDIAFFEYYRSSGLNADCDVPVFDFVHLIGAHDISEELSMLYPGNAGITADPVTTVRGEFEILGMWFDEMKQLGIYDNSTIIIIGDHGRPITYKEEIAEKLDSPILTGLLIKPAGAERGQLRTDMESELYNVYFTASILEYAGIDHSELGVSYNDAITTGLRTERIFRPYDFGGHYNRPQLPGIYRVNGNAMDFSNWEYTKIQ